MLRLQPVSRQVLTQLILHYLAISLSSPVCYAYVCICMFYSEAKLSFANIGVNDFKREKTYRGEES